MIFYLLYRISNYSYIDTKLTTYIAHDGEYLENGNRTEHIQEYNTIIHDIANTINRIANVGDVLAVEVIMDHNPVDILTDMDNFGMLDDIIMHIELGAMTPVEEHLGNMTLDWKVSDAKRETKKIDGVNRYFNKSKHIRSDGQNVHDTSVNKDLRDTYSTLKAEEHFNTQYDTMQDIRAGLSGRALEVFDHINKNSSKVFSLGDNVYLKSIVPLVWNRAYHPLNVNVKDMHEAFRKALEDCYENGHIVCTGGICARILSSLALLDMANKSLGCVNTMEQYKAEMYSNAQDILNDVIREVKGSDMEQFAMSFNDISIDEDEIPEDVKNRFYSIVEDRIDHMLQSYNPRNVPKNMKRDIMAGIRL